MSTFYKGCWFSQLINAQCSFLYPLKAWGWWVLERAAQQLCTAVMRNRSCMKPSFQQDKPAEDAYRRSHGRHKNISSALCETWELCCVSVSFISWFLIWKLFTYSETKRFWDAEHLMAWPQLDLISSKRWQRAVSAFTQPASPATPCLQVSLSREGRKKTQSPKTVFIYDHVCGLLFV